MSEYFLDDMASRLERMGFEEDEFAEGSGRTFRNINTVYFEPHGGKICMSVSRMRNTWDDSKAWELELPNDCLESRDFKDFLAEVIRHKEEE